MGFIGWLKKVAGGAVGKLDDVVHLLRVGLSGLWHVLTNLGHTVGKAWRRFTGAISWLASWLEQTAHAVAVSLRHLLIVVIPRAVRGAVSVASAYARRIVNTLDAWTRSALDYLRTHLAGLIADLRSWAADAVRFLTRQLSETISTLTRTASRVWSLLDKPEHLAEWVLGALAAAAVAWARKNAVKIGRWVIRSAAPAVLDELPALEDWVAKII